MDWKSGSKRPAYWQGLQEGMPTIKEDRGRRTQTHLAQKTKATPVIVWILIKVTVAFLGKICTGWARDKR